MAVNSVCLYFYYILAAWVGVLKQLQLNKSFHFAFTVIEIHSAPLMLSTMYL